MSEPKQFELFVHFHQGDELAKHLQEVGSVSAAFYAWSSEVAAESERIHELGVALEGQNVQVQAEGDTILLIGNGEALNELTEVCGHVDQGPVTKTPVTRLGGLR